MPPKNKRPSATNSHDKRHENGLVQPAHNHRLAAKRSSSRLNGHPRDDAVAYSSARSSDLAPVVAATTPPSDVHAASDLPSPPTDTDLLSGSYLEDRVDMAAHDGVADLLDSSNGLPPESARENLLTAAGKRQANHDGSATVIATRSLYDIVAILVLLLFLPANPLIMLQLGFSYLTWGSTPVAWNPSSWVQSHGGNPSLLVTAVSDIVFLGLWLAMPIAKDFVLDFAQAVVAVKIGGGATDKLLSPANLTCMAIITGLHMTRITPSRYYNFNFLSPLLAKADFGNLGIPKVDVAAFTWRFHPRQRTVFRVLLEAHIIVQGIIRVVRRSVEPRTPFPKRRSDPEIAAAASQSANSQDTTTNENLASAASHHGNDARAVVASSPAGKEGKDKSTWNNRRRRRRGETVRRQQPFWAAIANARVSVAKDLEQTQALDDGTDEPSSTGISSIISTSGDDRLWITEVLDKEVLFEAVLSQPSQKSRPPRESGSSTPTDDTRPAILYVRVNKAKWTSMNIEEVTKTSDGTHQEEKIRLTGRISGLTASTSFWLEFVRSDNDSVIYSSNLLTRSVANAATGVTLPAPPAQALRPSSPTTTLKQSIATSESQRDEQRNRLRKNRRDRRNVLNQLKREVDSVETKLASCGGADERHRQRTYQLEQSIKHLETEADSTASNIESLGDIPADEVQRHTKAKQQSDESNSRLKATQGQVKESKNSNDSSLNASRSAKDTVIQKRERLDGRLTKNAQRHEELRTEIAQRKQESDRKEQHRISVSAWREGKEREIMNTMMMHENARQLFDGRRAQLEQDAYRMFGSTDHLHGFPGQPFIPASSIPETPEQAYSSLNNHSSMRMPNFGPNPVGTPPVYSRRGSLVGGQKTRGRSSSMLSDISGLTEDELTPAASHMPPAGFMNGAHPPSMPATNSFGFNNNPSNASFGEFTWAGDPNRKRSSGSGSFSFATPAQVPQRSGSANNGPIGHAPQREPSNTSPISKQSPIGSSRGRGSPRTNGNGK